MRILLLASLVPALAAALSTSNSFHEALTLHPLPDGKLSVLFEFTTYFASASTGSSLRQSHHYLTPPSLLLPLEHNNISELTVSFVAGQWDQRRSGEAGPLHYESGGGGGEVRGWLRSNGDKAESDRAWTAVTHALGGLFCAGLGPSDEGDIVRSFGDIYPPHRGSPSNLTHYLLPHPFLHLCTENLTPFLSLLPSKGLSGLSSLLAQPGTVFSWGFKSEGIEVIMPDETSPGRWRGWWEGVVDLVPERGGSRAFSLERIFGRGIPRPFPEAETSVLRLMVSEGMSMEPEAPKREGKWIDGRYREVAEWDLLEPGMQGRDVRFWWDGERDFVHPRTLRPPSISVLRTVTAPHASDGTFTIRFSNAGSESRRAVYSEVWPWWVKGWISEISLRVDGSDESRDDLLDSMSYHPSTPPTPSTTSLHLFLTLPAQSTLVVSIPFTKLTLKYTEHRPDAERGVEIPSGILNLLDTIGEPESVSSDVPLGVENARQTARRRIYTNRLLLDVPTPDFSMPYNVIIMSSTVMAVFFGLMQGALTRKWGWVELPKGEGRGKQGEDEPKAGVSVVEGGAQLAGSSS
ncbi:Subunit of the glycosylphosphatidylinositol transamidase complex-like protein [Saitozyma podzolica]|uniref:Subunit of the glycosylphosphatidylinositol transamidase complex-like protein n=1 Tax=Saitozyma podzolica TaxID=1890683 RepID=A0A427Y3I0_9TREE|nr:Subunit of the glycosylphosphatidylinositol transamidase complex-like protein [Saitozyma podzolica]